MFLVLSVWPQCEQFLELEIKVLILGCCQVISSFDLCKHLDGLLLTIKKHFAFWKSMLIERVRVCSLLPTQRKSLFYSILVIFGHFFNILYIPSHLTYIPKFQPYKIIDNMEIARAARAESLFVRLSSLQCFHHQSIYIIIHLFCFCLARTTCSLFSELLLSVLTQPAGGLSPNVILVGMNT